MKLAGKIALITGAGSGMGRAASLLFAGEGAKIAAIDLNLESAEQTVQMIAREKGTAFAIRADVSKSEDARAMVETTVNRFGALNVLYNNAGIEGEGGFIAQLSDEAFDRVIAINLRGVWLGMKHALPHMIKAGGGSIINTASIAGLVAVRATSSAFPIRPSTDIRAVACGLIPSLPESRSTIGVSIAPGQIALTRML